METLENLVGNQEDWANYVTNVEMRDQPFLDWLPVGSKPANVLFNYQADKFRTPRDNSHVDGKPWTAAAAAGDKRGKLNALVQWFDNGVAVSKLTQDVSNIAGIEDELAREIPKAVKEMAQDQECAYQDDHDGREDNKVVGYKSRAVGEWIKATAQTTYPVPADFLVPSASIVAGTSVATATEDTFRGIFGSMWDQSKSKETVTGFVGRDLKVKFSDFQFYLPSSASTQTAGQFTKQFKDRTIDRVIDRYEGDLFPVELVLTPWLVTLTGTATAQKGRGHFLHRSMWELRWNQKPKVYRPEFKGGSYEAYMDMIAMLVCKNPLAEGKFAPS